LPHKGMMMAQLSAFESTVTRTAKVGSLFAVTLGLATTGPSIGEILVAPTTALTSGPTEVQVTLKPGESYNITFPKTEYPGAPFDVEIADPGNIFYNCCANSWLMRATVSTLAGSISWLSIDSQSGGRAGSAQSGQTALVSEISDGTATAAILQAVPSGKRKSESLQLIAPASSPFGAQTFVIKISV
jgi:hypothetical protein